GGTGAVHGDAEASLPPGLMLVVYDVPVDAVVGFVDVQVPLRTVEREQVDPPARAGAVDRAVDGRRHALVALANAVEVVTATRAQTFLLTRRQTRQRGGRDTSHRVLAADLPAEAAVEASRRRMQRAHHQALFVHPLDGER